MVLTYEVAMGLSLVAVLDRTAADLRPSRRSSRRSIRSGTSIPHVPRPSSSTSILRSLAETSRAPFDLPEAESELVAGFHTEYGGIRFAMFFLGEYIHVVVISAMAVTLFFGGWHGPAPDFLEWLWPVVWFVVKTRRRLPVRVAAATMPRLRYDRLMWLGWKVLIPRDSVELSITRGRLNTTVFAGRADGVFGRAGRDLLPISVVPAGRSPLRRSTLSDRRTASRGASLRLTAAS